MIRLMKKSIFFFLIILIIFIPKLQFNKINTWLKLFIYKQLILPYSFYSKCDLPRINYVPKESVVVIGHAYGSNLGGRTRNHKQMSLKVNNFLSANKFKIRTLILTGDIFTIPSDSNWSTFYDSYINYFKIIIAPGNHDVGIRTSNKMRKLFNKYASKYQSVLFPYVLEDKDFIFIVDDSNKKLETFPEISKLKKITKSENKKVVLIRHHVAIKELKALSNDTSDFGIIQKEKLSNYANNFKEFTMIYGNGGKSRFKPRIACLKDKNITHILNGIGDFRGDKLLILKDFPNTYILNFEKYIKNGH